MTKTDLTLILSIWGALLSSVLFIFNLLKFRMELSGKIKISYHFSDSIENLEITIINTSFRPVTLLSYEFHYAANEYSHQLILDSHFNPPIKIAESETHRITTTRSHLQAAVREKSVKQQYYHSIYLVLNTTHSGTFRFDVSIPSVVITGEFYERAKEFIAADIYLGFPQRESLYYPSFSTKYK